MVKGKNQSKIFEKVLNKVKPSPEDIKKEQKFIGTFLEKLNAATPENIIIELAGSTAKGTNLKGDRDFDVFMLFSKDYSVKQLMALGLQYAKKAAKGHKYEIAYAEHPYLRMWIKDSQIDIVPSFKITDIKDMQTSVDRSPLHTKFVNSNITNDQRDQVRLLKKFLKGIGVYGAEGKTQGFSGYLCELLILEYKSLVNLLEAASKWSVKPLFDSNTKEDRDNTLRKKFENSAMVYIDPVDSNRNVAAAVSKTSLSVFIYSAREFLKKPSERYFFKRIENINKTWMNNQLSKRNSLIVGIEFKKPQIVDDILWPQLYKFATKISARAKDNGFSVFDTDIQVTDNCIVLFEFEIFKLPEVKKVFGPPMQFESEVEKFVKKHKVIEPIWFENDRILSLGKRTFITAEKLLEDVLKKPGIYGVPSDIKRKVRTARILNVNSVKKKYPVFLFSYLKKRNF